MIDNFEGDWIPKGAFDAMDKGLAAIPVVGGFTHLGLTALNAIDPKAAIDSVKKATHGWSLNRLFHRHGESMSDIKNLPKAGAEAVVNVAKPVIKAVKNNPMVFAGIGIATIALVIYMNKRKKR